jgi:hypothetical protein
MKIILAKTIAGVAMAALLSGSAYAATQGILGATSSGTSLITAGKANAVKITGITDLTFPSTATVPTLLSDSVCVYATAGPYTDTLTLMVAPV